MYKRICLTCGVEDDRRIIPTIEGYEVCTHCGESIFDVIEEEPSRISNKEMLAFKLYQQCTDNIF